VVRTLALAIALLAGGSAGCELFVDVPNATLVGSGSGDGNVRCTDSSTCAAPTPVCELASGACVACLTSPDCASSAPVCEANACRGCRTDTECPSSNVCLTDGTCADPARVLYASSTGTAPACTVADPCSFDTAVGLVTAATDIIKLAPGTYDRPAQLSITKNTIITGEGATFHGTSAQSLTLMFDVTGVALTVQNVHFDLAGEIGIECMTGSLNLDRVILVNGAAGAYANACTFTVSRSLVDANSFYGLYMTGATVAISNTYITNNGASSQGGLVIATSTGTIDHVTLTGNSATLAGARAIRCTDSATLGIHGSIVFGHAAPSIDAGCAVDHSIVDPDYTGGTGNVTMDPLFVAPGTRDYHLQSGSPAAGLAVTSMFSTDFDGEPRPQPAGSTPDSGADEIP
jgi:hypothetical protein